jgi:xanthine dehydrogenase molybdopterin-binding subunit B
MLAMSVWLAIRDAVSAFASGASTQIALDAPATPERILRAIKTLREPLDQPRETRD